MMTESPLRNILAMNLFWLICLPFFPFLPCTVSVQISCTSSNTMLQCLSNALMVHNSLWLLRQLISTGVLLFMHSSNIDNGPLANSSSSSSSTLNDFLSLRF
eukprot:TRINITY_DN690_c0_g1_i1.p2 TRINITY_DN690_c0_g1~~TRINITY_DN690_c0_g1_i1.p2  ORF type:complete len:102 (-),score=19.57 TRINITY_DN690_c0_g1_i1:672-977(-)